jgi:glycosyltransferase involved in cell wall biosynthesis
MIFFDVTKAGSAGHRSGLMRVSARLADRLGSAATKVSWDEGFREFKNRKRVIFSPSDWFFTGELFSEEERPGFSEFLAAHPCRLAAIFHDAIPLKLPQITWPQSVGRHPGYMKLLARFDRVWAVSDESRADLAGFWRWQGLEKIPPIGVLALGADFNAAPRISSGAQRSTLDPQLLCVGILEPRKNQSFLLDVCEELWNEGLRFELHLVGRVNPHFGRPLVARIKSLRKKIPSLRFHAAANDAAVARLYATARASVFPTIAEGCGLPLLESLWMGVPCVCSDLPVLRENAAAGGCLSVAPNDRVAWKDALRRVLTDDTLHAKLTSEATTRALPAWSEAAQTLRAALSR